MRTSAAGQSLLLGEVCDIESADPSALLLKFVPEVMGVPKSVENLEGDRGI
jgi:hypothetical protein